MAIHITGLDDADQILTDNPFALLAGMMLDQQYPMEHAFRGPAKVAERFGCFDPERSRRPTRDVRGAVRDPPGDPQLPRLDVRPPAGARDPGDEGTTARRSASGPRRATPRT